MPISTRSPCAPASSSSQAGGTVYVRTVFTPFAVIAAKSAATTSGAGNGPSSWRSSKVPYVTPRR